MLRFSDSRNFTRTLAALGLIVAPLMLLAAAIIGPDISGDDYVEELASIADNEAAWVISGILFLFAPLVLLPGMLGVIRLLRRRGVTLGQVGAGLIMFGALLTMAFYGWGAIEYVAATEDGVDRGQMATVFDAAEDSVVGVPIWVGGFIIGLTIGSILLAIGLWRNRVVPIWSPIALVLSTLINFFGAEEKWVAAASFVLLFIALWPLAQKLLSISDDEWEDWHLPEPD
ncbi:MAG: hypothetical protein ACRDKV_04975, partial [Solirubrobacterales bacterium]